MPRGNYKVTARSFDRGLDATSGVEMLPPNALRVAQNVRYSRQGGVFTRPGYEEKADLGTSAKVDTIATMNEFDVMFAKSGTDIQQSLDGSTWYSIGDTRTAGEREFLYPYRGHMFATNATDGFTRIAVSTLQTAITAGVSTSVVLRTGDGDNFPTSGTIYIEGDAITVTNKSTDTLTVTAGTIGANHGVGTIITYVADPSGAPDATAIADLDGSLLTIHQDTVKWSAPSTDANPEYAYDFTGNGAGSQVLPSNGRALLKVTGGVIIGHDDGMEFAYAFDIDTGALLTRPLSTSHSVPNAFSFAQGDKVSYVFTGRRILPIASDSDGVRIIEEIFKDEGNLDYPVRALLEALDANQSLSFAHYDPVCSELTVSVQKDGISQEFVYSEDLGTWSVDTGKTFACKTNFDKRVYAGSDNDDKIYLDGELTTDDEIPILHRIVTGVFTVEDELLSSDYLTYAFSGLLSGDGQFTFRVYVDGELENEEEITATALQSAELMSVTSGTPIGGGTIGAETIGFGTGAPDAYRFTYPYEMLTSGQNIQFEWEILDEGTMLELRKSRLGADTANTLELTTQ